MALLIMIYGVNTDQNRFFSFESPLHCASYALNILPYQESISL